MLIHLKKNEKLYLNGAVIRLDRRGTLELMNDAHFLLENHILQPELATTPLRQIYFIVQMMLMDPPNAYLTMQLFKNNIAQIRATAISEDYVGVLDDVEAKIAAGSYYDAMKCLRQSFNIEERIFNSKPNSQNSSLEAA